MVSSLKVNLAANISAVLEATQSDISTKYAIFDLIDNSIDAARKSIKAEQISKGLDPEDLPKSYEGYKINIYLSNDELKVEDNCGGMDEETLRQYALAFGERKQQDSSIGVYGVGLIRTLWKIGREYSIETDNGASAFTLKFDEEMVRNNSNNIFANRVNTKEQNFNRILVSQLRDATLEDFGDKNWLKNFRSSLSRTYGICIAKQLSISVNNEAIEAFCPQFREDLTDIRVSSDLITNEGVKVHIDVGVHEKYTYAGEENHSIPENKKITNEFGWYVVCNDRVVLLADKSQKVGWATAWHSEYNGFLGWVYFNAKDSSKLPWVSQKSDISAEKRSLRDIQSILKQRSDEFRSESKKLLNNFKSLTKDKAQTNTLHGLHPESNQSSEPKPMAEPSTKEDQVPEHDLSGEWVPTPENNLFGSEKTENGIVDNLPSDGSPKSTPPRPPPTATMKNIRFNNDLGNLLERISSAKPKYEKSKELYYCLCRLSFRDHSCIIYLVAGVFFESIARNMGHQGDDWAGHLNREVNKINNGQNKNKQQNNRARLFNNILIDIQKEYNSLKHQQIYVPLDLQSLANKMETISQQLIDLLSAVSNI